MNVQDAAPEPGDSLPELLARLRHGRLARWLYSNNPFYVISAWLVFVGLRMSFDTSQGGYEAGGLMFGLASYTLLLAGSAILLIRLGKVWDDARSLLLLVLLLLLAVSVCFDGAIAADRHGGWIFVGGWLFAVVVSESLLLGTGIRLPALYRGPYYLLLSLFFLYPIGLAPLIDGVSGQPLHLALLGFPVAVGAVLLTLLPAIWHGPRYTVSNGTPWKWPLFPWTLFATLTFCALARTYYLCASFSMFDIFQIYFLAPILLAASLLVLELGLVSKSSSTQRLALVVPLLLVAMTYGVASKFGVTRFDASLQVLTGATPLFLALVSAVALYGWAVFRRAAAAPLAFAVALGGLSVIGPTTAGANSLHQVWGVPLLLAGLFVALRAVRHQDLRLYVAASTLATCGGYVELRELGWRSYLYAKQQLVGLEFIAAGALFFVIAALISLGKAGLLQQSVRWLRERAASRRLCLPDSEHGESR